MKKNFRTGMLVLSVFLTLASCSGNRNQERVEPLSVTTETVGTSVCDEGMSYVGTVEASTSTAVSFTGMGMVTRVCVDEGQHVSKGQLIAEMDRTQAENALANAKAQLMQANDAQNRMKQLHDKQSLSDMKWVEVQSKVEQAQSMVAVAKKNLADCSIYAPVSGVIGKKSLNAGETALPSQPVVTILDISSVKIRVSIPEKEIASIAASTPSDITVDALGGQTFHGGEIEKGVVADEMTHTYDIKINVINPNGTLLEGMVAQVKFNAECLMHNAECRISVPVRCVQESADEKTFVWTVNAGKAHRQNVTLGATTGNRIEVTAGLSKGEKVITSGYQKVSEGSKVK